MTRDTPLVFANPAGLRLELGRDGGVRRILRDGDAVNLFHGNGMEPGPANLWLRLHAADRLAVVPLLGPESPLLTAAAGEVLLRRGAWQGLAIALRLALAPDAATWCWQVEVENEAAEARTFDLVVAQDLALASPGAVRLNEYYVSHYLDLSPLSHPRCGWVVAARQNQAQDGHHPWAVVGSLRRAAAFATDGLQVFGLAGRWGGAPAGLPAGLPARRLQHEHALAALQDEPVTVGPGARAGGGFFFAVEPDHPAATGPGDLGAVDRALAWAGTLGSIGGSRPGAGLPAAPSLFATAPALETRDLDEPELRSLFPRPWRHEERAGATLLSFFRGERDHVVLRAKETLTLRPHGRILRTGGARAPDEAALTSTAWMAGVFHSMVTQGHVSLNRFVSTVHGGLGLSRSHGLRLFVGIDGAWHLLGLPSAFELGARACRWLYRHRAGLLEVTSAASAVDHALTLQARVLEGPPVAWLATLHLALGGDDGNAPLPVPWRVEGDEVLVAVPAGSPLHARFPDGTFAVAPAPGAPPFEAHGDEWLFPDGGSRGLPFLALEGAASARFGLALRGRLVAGVPARSELPALPVLTAAASGGEAAAELARLSEILPWFLDDALVHYLAPRGLEQYSGGGWGTRDVCQGPLELLLALDQDAAARELLLRVFAAQDEDGGWPQWFQFFERERQLRAPDAHGDVVFWPILAVARYLLATGDAALLGTPVAYHAPPERTPRAAPLVEHLDRALAFARARCISGTALAAYGHGDWNDAMQPADPALRERLCSTWTVTLHHQAWTALGRALRGCGEGERAAALDREAERIRRDLRTHLLVDGVLAGYADFGAGGAPEPLIHPRDRRTGLRFGLLHVMHAVLEDLLTPEEAAAHLALVREHLWAPDGARLFDRPLPYRGGVQRLFQRAETSAFFGREIGLLYTHAHLRYAQMQAHVGDARGFLRSLALAHPVLLRERLPQAALRQASCYYSSSDAAFEDRYEAERRYGEVAAGTVPLDGGWRVYSSGPGIALALVVDHLLGVRREGGAVVVDPVLSPELDGLRAEVHLLGTRLRLEYAVGGRGCGPRALVLNGAPLAFERRPNPYRTGGAAVPRERWAACARADGSDLLRVELG